MTLCVGIGMCVYLSEGDASSSYDHEQKTQPTEEKKIYREDPNFDRNLDEITAELTPFLKRHPLERIKRERCHNSLIYPRL
jgi:hypothetical protein